MEFPQEHLESPNADRTRLHERLGVAMHHTVLSYRSTLNRMMDPTSQVSYHGVVARDGRRCQLVPDSAIAWHAGVSIFRGRPHCNTFLLGLAFEGDTYVAPLTEAQILSALDWLGARWERYGWSLGVITDHRQIAPERKNDLNPSEWNRLFHRIEEWRSGARQA